MNNNLNEYYKDLSEKIRWAIKNEKILSKADFVSLKENEFREKVAKELDEYRRDCNIMCRDIQLLKNNKDIDTKKLQRLYINLIEKRFDNIKELVDKLT